jgi:hypothetical protein
MKSIGKDADGLWVPMADPREFLIGMLVIAGALIALYFLGLLFVVAAGMVLFIGIICAVQLIPPLEGLPGLVVGSVLIVVGLILVWIANNAR